MSTTATSAARPSDSSNLAAVIQAFMAFRGITTHAEMASVLGVDRTLVSKYLTGARTCHDVTQLRRFAEAMDLSPEVFGLLPEPFDARAPRAPDNRETQRWRHVRQTLNRNRTELTRVAAALHLDADRIAGTACLTTPGWMPPTPDAARRGRVGMGSAATRTCRPRHGPGDGSLPTIGTEWRAVHPVLPGRPRDRGTVVVENRGSYRLLGLDWTATAGAMTFGYTTYFDMIDVCEVLAHELAGSWMRRRDERERVTLDDLPFRRHVGDLFDLHRRPVLPSVNTLTIRRGPDGDSFFLHRRGSGQVAVAGGQSHVIPAGVFQPSGIAPWNMAGDFDLWRSMLREYSEEMLGNPEHDGSSGAPIDYDREEPFRTMNEGRRAGLVRPWILGVGVDPLVPAGEILTVTVIEAEVFDEAFGAMVDRNAEGEVAVSDAGRVGIAWTAANVRRVQTDEPLACAAAACMALTWQHRDLILAA